MDENMTAVDGAISIAGGVDYYQGQTVEELAQLLMCASMELQKQREAKIAQEQLHEAREMHLEELLKTTRRERDEFRDQCMQLQGRLMSNSRSMSGLTQEPQLRTRSGIQPLESVSSMSEPSRATLSEVHTRKFQPEYVSSMTEPSRDTLTEAHRKMQKQHRQQQHQQQQQLEFQQFEQLHQHHMDLQHSNHLELDMRPSPTTSHLEFQSQHFVEMHQHYDIQQKEHLQGQAIAMDMVISERQSELSPGGDVDNGSDAKSTTWNEFPSGVLDLHSSDEQCLMLDSTENMHIKLSQGLPTQGLPTSHVGQRASPSSQLEELLDQRSSPSSHLEQLQQQQQDDNLQMHLQQQQQQQQDDNLQVHLHHQQQESAEILSHMQQGQAAADAHCLHLQQEDQKLRRQLSKRQEGSAQQIGLQSTNDGVLSMTVLQQHTPQWPVGLMGLSSSPLSNGPNGISEQLLQSSCLQGGSVVASILSPLERFGDSGSTSMLLARPAHLPEPPESDPQVMLSSLPEKGKLLQAVIQAGPTLQSLLLAGPLPQWRHPPPPLHAEEIPRVLGCSALPSI